MEAAARRVANCAWCRSPLNGRAVRLPGRVRCPECGVATTDPWPSETELDRAYGDWYRPGSGRFGAIGDGLLRRTRGHLARRLDRIAPAGPVLDVGAGEGALLDALRRRGREAIGLERDSRRADVRDEPLSQMAGEWAAVVFWHSLEHLPEAGSALQEAARLLRPGGVVIIAVPNADSLQARAFGDRWLALDLPRHLVHIPAPAVLSRLRECGFRVERVSYTRAGQIVIGWLHGLVGALPGELRLYQTLRRPDARDSQLPHGRRLAALGSAGLLLPVALTCAGLEIVLRRSGTVYVEARLA